MEEKLHIRLYLSNIDTIDVESKNLFHQFINFLHIKNLTNLKIFTLYDIFFQKKIDEETAKKFVSLALTERMTQRFCFDFLPETMKGSKIFAVSLLSGQYDQKAESAASCITLVSKIEDITVKTAKIYCLFGNLDDNDLTVIKNYLVNPVDSCLLDIDDLNRSNDRSLDVVNQDNFNIENFNIEFELKEKEEILKVKNDFNLAMSVEDLEFIGENIKKENRKINLTELRILDTYWSDHCRHTTFNTELEVINIQDVDSVNKKLSDSLNRFFWIKNKINKNKINEKLNKIDELDKLDITSRIDKINRIDITDRIDRNNKDSQDKFTLMELATINAKYLKILGLLKDLEESQEINACSVIVKDNKEKEWLIEFKNETHNHPTEIEPFGGASTCIGGAIRDPLSSRAYVFGAMRVSGSADPNQPIENTLKGKLPQRKITTTAAKGFSSYGNQIGLATGQVVELYHENYVAKRLEAGAVIGAVPKENVVRANPKEKDVIVLVGGRTGRDGIGGATGSSKNHDENSVKIASSEVQKGNPVIERKLQRFFSNPQVTKLILKCNDFGAGGVAVAVGELADGLNIYLDKIPLKYKGLNPQEIILSESQERMACVIEKKNLKKFIKLALQEDLEASFIAQVTAEKSVNFIYKDKIVASIPRQLLDSKGAKRASKVKIKDYSIEETIKYFKSFMELKLDNLVKKLNVSLQVGLNQIFDSTIGANTIFLPYGGRYQLSPTEGIAFTLPEIYGKENFIDMQVKNQEKEKAVLMSMGFDPYLLSINPYLGGYYSVIEAITKIIAMGGNLKQSWLSLQDFFGKTSNEEKYGVVVSALLGAFAAELDLGIAAIGGKDSMSGTFNGIDVPPTLITFAVSFEDADSLIPSCFIRHDSFVYLLYTPMDSDLMIDKDRLLINFEFFRFLIKNNAILSARSIRGYSINEAIAKSCFGSKIGFKIDSNFDKEKYFNSSFGSIIFESLLDIDKLNQLSIEFKNELKNDLKDKLNENLLNENLKDSLKENVYFIGRTSNKKSIIIGEKGGIQEYDIEYIIEESRKRLEEVFPSKIEDKPDYTKEEFNRIVQKDPGVRYNGKGLNLRTRPKALILVFSGTNCEFDTKNAFEKAGIEAEILVVRSLNKNLLNESIKDSIKKISESQIICIPGGFSMGDEPDGSGKFIVSFLRSPKIKNAIEKHLEKKNLILGICNGFQALIKSGLLPYGKIMQLNEDDASLVQNLIGTHISRMVNCKVLPNKSPWHILSDYQKVYSIPVSHGEGRFFCSKEFAQNLFKNGQVSSVYVDIVGELALNFPENPNGSIYAIESLISPDGLILGKMGHTERVVESRLKNYPNAIAEPIFESAFRYFR